MPGRLHASAGSASLLPAGSDRTLALYAQGLGVNLPPEAVYVGYADFNVVVGAETPRGVRYPLSWGLLGLPWYDEAVAPQLEKRVVPGPALVDSAYAMGLEVASDRRALLEQEGRVVQLRGLLYVTGPSIRHANDEQTLSAALELCPLVEKLEPLPPRGHDFSRVAFQLFCAGVPGRLRVPQAGARL
jgi:hypothetical protein